MNWIKFKDQLPKDGQSIWYYGEYIGVWRGTYRYTPSDAWSPHIIHCSETFGIVDRMDAPYWIAYNEGSVRPDPPELNVGD